MQKIAIMVAMKQEFELFAGALQGLTAHKNGTREILKGSLHNKEIAVAVSQIGKVNAALCAADLINTFHPDIIINIGISGGIDSSLNIGDFVFGEHIVYHDVWCGEPNKYGQIQDFPDIYGADEKLLSLFPDFKKGLICCGDKFITQTEEKNAIKKHFPQALAVDMESAAIAQTCWLYAVPLLSLRQISDTPGEHQAAEYEQFWRNAPQNSMNIINTILERL